MPAFMYVSLTHGLPIPLPAIPFFKIIHIPMHSGKCQLKSQELGTQRKLTGKFFFFFFFSSFSPLSHDVESSLWSESLKRKNNA